MADLGLCDVCGLEPAVGVACSAIGPMSFAYGRQCLELGTEQFGLLKGIYDDCGGVVVDWFMDIDTIKNGEHMTFRAALKVGDA